MEDTPILLANPLLLTVPFVMVMGLAMYGYVELFVRLYVGAHYATTVAGRLLRHMGAVAVLLLGFLGFIMLLVSISTLMNLAKYGVQF